MKTIRKLAKFINGCWKDTILTWIFVLVESVCEVMVAFFMRFLIDSIRNISSVSLNDIYMYSAIIASIAIFSTAMGILAGYFAASASAGFGRNIRRAMYARIQDYSFRNIDKFSTSSIITRTTTDVVNVQNAFLQIIRAVVRAPFLMLFALIMCFVTEWKLAWVFLVIIPVILFALLFIASKAHPIFVKVFNTYDNLNEEVQEDIDGMRVVKSFNRENYQKEKFGKVSAFIYKNFVKAEKLLAFNMPVMNIAIYGAISVIAFFGAQIIVISGGNDLSIGGYTSLLTYVMMIMNSMMMISIVYVMLTIARNSAERINEIMCESPDIYSPDNAIKIVDDGEINFRNVNFAYNKGKSVLDDINLHISSGSMVGIIGSTGSSKTTLVSLIARLYDADSGDIDVAHHNVKEYDLKSLRDAVAVVLQKNTLFTGTIRDNLKWGDEKATDEEIMRVAGIAQVSSFITSSASGLDTMIVEGGSNVSGGQKQRLCIARALLKNPKILILDDSTSACDTHTDALIKKGLQEQKGDMTTIIIAQRVLSIKDCDQIIVMDHGRIEAMGNNDQLMKSSSIYKELYISQLGGGDFDAST
ncbi:MAG: ABC transporter ATP-binding protein [Bacilli bacterium]|jgi:ATP-binding cassette subfamily B protein